MNTTTLKALKSSINHWRRMANGSSKRGEFPGGKQCALCIKFTNRIKGEDVCRGCPVMQKTKVNFCHGTPFLVAWLLYKARGIKSKSFKAAAKLEFDFLVSLLPKNKRL